MRYIAANTPLQQQSKVHIIENEDVCERERDREQITQMITIEFIRQICHLGKYNQYPLICWCFREEEEEEKKSVYKYTNMDHSVRDSAAHVSNKDVQCNICIDDTVKLI